MSKKLFQPATLRRKDGHHPIITMQCGPVRYSTNAKEQAAARPFEHKVLVRPTSFLLNKTTQENVRMQFKIFTMNLLKIRCVIS